MAILPSPRDMRSRSPRVPNPDRFTSGSEDEGSSSTRKTLRRGKSKKRVLLLLGLFALVAINVFVWTRLVHPLEYKIKPTVTKAVQEGYEIQFFKLHIMIITDCGTSLREGAEDLPKGWELESTQSGKALALSEQDTLLLAANMTKNAGFKLWKNSIDSLLNSLIGADYEGDKVAITFLASCHNGVALQSIQSYLSGLQWLLGSKTVITNSSRSQFDISTDYNPTSPNEHLMFLSTAVVLKPSFYLEIKEFLRASLTLASLEALHLFGVSLLPLTTVVHDRNSSSAANVTTTFSTFPANHNSPSLLRGIGEDCQLITPSTWSNFIQWEQFKSSLTPPPPPPLPQGKKPWRPLKVYTFNSECDASWRSSMTSLMQSQGGFNVFLPSSSSQNGKLLCEPNPMIRASTAATQSSAVSGSGRVGGSMGRKRKIFEKDNDSGSDGNADVGDSLLALPRYSLCGTEMKAPMLATNQTELKALLAHLHVNKTVVAVMTSTGFEDMLENWLCYVAELDIHNYFIISDSLEQAKRLVKKGHSAFHLELPSSADRSLDYGSVGYKSFILERTRMVQNILQLRFHVLLADVDAVWLKNPFNYMRSKRVDIYAQLEPSGYLCGGFLYLRSTNKVLKLWKQVTVMFQKTVKRMADEIVTKKPEEMKAFLKHYEHLHEQRYINFLVTRNDSTVFVKGLDMDLFPNGRNYFAKQIPQKRGIEPAVIHNNYIVGKNNKTRRFVENGLWRVDPKAFSCICLRCRSNL